MPATRVSTQSLLSIGTDAAFATAVTEAAQKVFPDVKLRAAASLEHALAGAIEPGELLVLESPSTEILERTSSALDSSKLPRWPIVVLGEAPAGSKLPAANVVPRTLWSPALIGRVFLSALEQHRLAREATQLRGDLAAFGYRFAHDLRTPLGGIVTSAEMLREILGDEAPETAPLVQPILDSTDGLVKLIERMSLIAKTIAARESPQRLDMGQVFWNAFQKAEASLLKTGAVLDQPREWPEILGQATALEVVWRQLIANAIEHGEGGQRLVASWERQDGQVRFSLRSSGLVPAEKQSTLFFPLERLHEPGAPRGFGLPLIRRILERHGGKWGFEAPADGGSIFYFVLPEPGN